MATFDQLSAEQRAIIELVLKQGKSYDDLGTMLGMPSSRVRELAGDALVKLSPVSAASVDDDWRSQIADYLLNQQSGPEGTATKGHLRRSEAGRAWSRSVLDSLEQFYGDATIPTIPEGDPAAAPRRERRPKREKPAKPARKPKEDGDEPKRRPSAAAMAEVQRRRLIFGGGAALLIVLIVVLIWPVGLLTGGDDKKDNASSTTTNASAATRVLGQLVLRPVGNTKSKNAGLAVIVQRGGQRQLIVQAQLNPLKQKQAYEVWLWNSNSDAESIGAQVPDQKGTFQGAGPLPTDFSKYKYIDVSLEPIDKNAKHSNTSVLRGALADLQAPSQEQQQGGTTTPQGTTPAPQTTTPAPQGTTPGQ